MTNRQAYLLVAAMFLSAAFVADDWRALPSALIGAMWMVLSHFS